MPSDLDAFLARHEADAVQIVAWGTAASPIPLRIAGYLSEELPPLEYVTSVRGVVFRGNRVLVMRNRDEVHVLPGGQREGGETLVETLQREVLEEAGWTVEVGVCWVFSTSAISDRNRRARFQASLICIRISRR